MPQLAQLLPLVGIALIFWLLLIRPAQKRQRELSRMQGSLTVGDEVMLTSGVYGTLRDLMDDSVLVEVAPGVQLRVARGAVGSVVTPVTDPEISSETPNELPDKQREED